MQSVQDQNPRFVICDLRSGMQFHRNTFTVNPCLFLPTHKRTQIHPYFSKCVWNCVHQSARFHPSRTLSGPLTPGRPHHPTAPMGRRRRPRPPWMSCFSTGLLHQGFRFYFLFEGSNAFCLEFDLTMFQNKYSFFYCWHFSFCAAL